ncbi:hypothetical protein, partial [Enterobacter sp. PTB]|uniref:hypothetical protein n=1 Tax=Enterobacter sp. PTB TaxID=3143437 RepID=UPI003DA8AF6E
GAVATVTITSTILERSKHSRVVDTVQLLTPEVISEHRGCIFMKTAISGRPKEVQRAYETAKREARQ